MNKNKAARIILSCFVSFVILYFLFSNISIKNFLSILSKTNIYIVLGGLIFYFFLLMLRAFRFRVVLHKKISFREILAITLFHNLMSYLLPFRLGELSYIYLVKKTSKGSYTQAFSSLLIVRVFDFVILVSFLIIGIIFLDGVPQEIVRLSPILFLFLLIVLSATFLLIFYPQIFIRIFELFYRKLPFRKPTALKSAKDKLLSLFKSFARYNSKRILIETFILSVINFCIGFIVAAIILISLNYFIPIKALAVIIPFSSLSGVIPIQGIAGLGTFESFWIIALVPFGYSLEVAIILSFSIHVILFFYNTSLGILGWIGTKLI